MDILYYDFFQRALLGGILIGFTAPLIGVFLVLRRLSMIGDTLSHVSIAGVALGFLINVYPVVMGLLFALLAALAIEKLRRTYRSYAELSIAIILSGGIALAAFLFKLGDGYYVDLSSYLFGSIMTLLNVDLLFIFLVTIIVIVAIATNYKELFLLTFDEDAAAVNGLPIKIYNIMLTVMTALVVSVAIKIVGALLVSALLTIPVACSLLIAKGFKQSLIWAVVFSEVAVILGLLASGIWDFSPGGTVVLLLLVMLISVLVGKRGLRIS